MDEALALFAAGVDALFKLDRTAFTDQRLEAGFRQFVTECRSLAGVQNALLAELIDRCLPFHRKTGSTAMYLRSLVQVSIGEGRAWERDALELVPRRSLSGGELLPPTYPLVAAAVDAGAISTSNARLITDTLRRAPAAVGTDRLAWAEHTLVSYARRHDPAAVKNRCVQVAEELDPDGSLGSTRAERDRARSFMLGKQDRDGMYPVKGRLDPECGAFLQAAISPLAAPQPGPDGERDPRTAEQRNHDAIADLARRALAQGDLPERHGLPGKLIVKIDLEQLESRTGTATTIHGGRLPVRDLLRLATDMGVIPVVLDSDGTILHFGEEQRLATPEQRSRCGSSTAAARSRRARCPPCGPRARTANHFEPREQPRSTTWGCSAATTTASWMGKSGPCGGSRIGSGSRHRNGSTPTNDHAPTNISNRSDNNAGR